MDSNAPSDPPNPFPADYARANNISSGGSARTVAQSTSSHTRMFGTNNSTERRKLVSVRLDRYSGRHAKSDKQSHPTRLADVTESVKGMYRLLDLIGESGSNGYVDKIVIAQDSLQRFINAVAPKAYTSITKVDFKTLDQFMIKPLGVYGSKSEIVRLLRSIGALDENAACLLLAPTDVGDPKSTLSSGLYIVRAETTDSMDERHYVIYWPEDTTWDDSATSSVCRNRMTFMRYLTKICDQVVVLLSPEHSTSIVWNDSDSEDESVDVDTGDRIFSFEVAEMNEQEENVVTRPSFQMNSRYISYGMPLNYPVDFPDLVPRLLPGETTQGFLTATFIPDQTHSEIFDENTFSRVSLEQLLKNNVLVLSESLDENSVQTLVKIALADLFPERCNTWRAMIRDTRTLFAQELQTRKDTVRRELLGRVDSLRRVLRDAVVDDVTKLFPSLERDHLSTREQVLDNLDTSQDAGNPLLLSDLESLYPAFRSIYESHVRKARFDDVPKRDRHFELLKLRLVSIRHLLEKTPTLSPEIRADLTRTILFEGDLYRAQQILPNLKTDKNWGARVVGSLFSSPGGDFSERDMKNMAANVSDSQFLLDMKTVEEEEMRSAIEEVEALAHNQLAVSIDETVKAMTRAVLAMQQEHCERSIQHQIESEERGSLSDTLSEFIRDINARSAGQHDSEVYLEGIDMGKSGLYSRRHGQEYIITGYRKAHVVPEIEWRVHLMDLTNDDSHNIQLDPTYIPTPTVNDRLSSIFHIPVDMDIAFYQILENEKLLLVLLDGDRVTIFLARLPEMDMAIERNRPAKSLNREKLGEDILFAFDERKRTLAVCASSKLQLHMFVFDETFKALHGQGSSIDLATWYSQRGTSILHMAFVCGNEEVVLVDSSAQARIFSFVTLQFRPASLQLPSLPSAIMSSPDGSCLLVLYSEPSLTAYHWETFGSTGGIPLDVQAFPLQGAVLTSMVGRARVFLVGLDVDAGSIRSIALDITKKHTEFMFKENVSQTTSKNTTRHTLHNSLLDCHAEVWFRFPVIPAVSRRTVTSSSKREQKSLTFISENPSQPFASYFSDLIKAFEKTTRKPIGGILYDIKVSATQFGSFEDTVVLNLDWDVSRYRLGEWLVDLFCLIPIHIAVCRENTFIPLADGVVSSDLEQSLLGAEINNVVDKLSFGWYESIFQSYMATKPVKVVSSLGQQSVGKSFSLNHLLDTSFAGSAMRTTEGVWMSVTPTDEALIVALDFEGVGSVERSLQEDTLLVLFNTAISNLVLFRNNFVFSRDISGLFQSFQSSASSVLDPASNPSLFQSTLVIIIKDVVESDKKEITSEFSRKFQQIVQQEQRANFISRLHRGKLAIIPWPVIESKEFYTLFNALETRLKQQKITHPTAYEFLHTIKTLMAKLKAKDWGSLSQTMTEHRARTLSALLPIALATGYSETEPNLEYLKNFDTDLIVESDDTATLFAVSDCEEVPLADIEMRLAALRDSWGMVTPRQFVPDTDWTLQLGSQINGLVDRRVNHVQLWLDSNLERFQVGHATVEELRRKFDKMVIEMRTSVQLCRAQCASCHLLCVRSRLHMGEHSCETTHKCGYNCAFCEDEPKPCGTIAGHPGQHTCVVSAHLCGEPCKLSGKGGCLGDCTKVVGHLEDEHMCPVLVHVCGEPCALQEMILPDGRTYSCLESCSIPSDQYHEVHSCDSKLCPVTCDLCKRLCVQPHLHGLEPDVFHLCGEPHPCPELCSAPGICQIETTPTSVEATFTGRHEMFQYTKYSQDATRLPCVKTMEPGQTSHIGDHIHIKDEQPFHFCETRCQDCGYFCTLPHGHPQQEHETSHGSMTQTRWAIHGPDEAGIELGGRLYSSNDEGAPMMCNLVCSSMGRHIHIDYCRAEEDTLCGGAEVQHINARMTPNPDKPKDAITHNLYWRRMAMPCVQVRHNTDCYAACLNRISIGPEHLATAAGPGQPSYCKLPILHPPRNPEDRIDGHGYISNDGHLFECRNPGVMQQAFHIIFVIDRSRSMCLTDHKPLIDAPAANRIRRRANNRLGAVYSALYSFWSARDVAVNAGYQTDGLQRVGAAFRPVLNRFLPALSTLAAGAAARRTVVPRRDAYSVVLFNEATKNAIVNDLTKTPDELLAVLLSEQPSGSTDFSAALRAAEAIMLEHWDIERAPIIVFLSDGECSVPDGEIRGVCHSASQRGKPLSFHAVSFGIDASTLRRMANLALEIQNGVLRPGSFPSTPYIPSSFATALNTVRLTETFLGIAESLRSPRGALIH
ncbi:hypothetical protein BJV78DRAFT_1393001 [Lactifluus subvellereus]|nr:hypothetical protein BJV78DRAFT_1393001 [Lactifluus subvellereus]